jgi:hypothetical protein
LAEARLRASDAVAIEKPFGADPASPQHLNQIQRIQLPQPVIFRIDHFLSNELVRRVVTLRFLNRVFEPTRRRFVPRSARRSPAGGGHTSAADDTQPNSPRPLHRRHDRHPAGALLR